MGTPVADWPDPIALLQEQAETRVPELVPIRYGRMPVTPGTFYVAPRCGYPAFAGGNALRQAVRTDSAQAQNPHELPGSPSN